MTSRRPSPWGISIKKVFAIAWAIAAIVASVGGILLGNINGVNASLSTFGLKVFPAVILGGLDSIPGAILGGFAIGILEALSGMYLDPLIEGGSKEVVPFIVLVVVLMVKPYGAVRNGRDREGLKWEAASEKAHMLRCAASFVTAALRQAQGRLKARCLSW